MVNCARYTPQRLGMKQRAKKVVSDSPGLVNFAIGLVNSVQFYSLPFGEIRPREKI